MLPRVIYGYTFLVLSLLGPIAHGQKNISDSIYWSVTENNEFPIFNKVAGENVSFKINAFLQLTLLNKLITPETSDPFEALEQGTSFLNYQVLRNDARVLSLRFAFEGCGAYCENYDLYFSFNSESGEVITVRDIFTEEGYNSAKWKIAEERKSLLQKEINRAKEQIGPTADSTGARQQRNEEISTTLADQITLYEDCLERRDSGDVDTDSFYLSDSSVWFIGERCSNHAMRAIDDLDQFEDELKLVWLESRLNRYGKYLFGLGSKKNGNIERFKIYSGTIAGKYPIWFFVNTTGPETLFAYCYQKYGVIIELRNNGDSQPMALTEISPEGDEIGKINISKSGGGYSGKYINTSGEELNFKVTPLR
jgi:hypothetical protein